MRSVHCSLHSTAIYTLLLLDVILLYILKRLYLSLYLEYISLSQVYKDINGVVYAATLGHVDIAKGDGMILKFIESDK